MKSTTPKRADIAKENQWKLELLFESEQAWQSALQEAIKSGERVLLYKDTFENPAEVESATLLNCLQAFETFEKQSEKLGQYAFLKKSEDEGNSENIARLSQYIMAMTEISAKLSWFVPALMQIPEDKVRAWIDPSGAEGKAFADYKIFIEKTLYLKVHTLSDREEKMLTLLSESGGTAQRSFSVLTNVDLQFGSITDRGEEKELTQSSFSQFLLSPDRAVREKAYKQFYAGFDAHKNTIASLYIGQVQQNTAMAKIRGYGSARENALYPDKVPVSVYDNLIKSVRDNLEPLHRFYALVQKTLKVEELRHYDVYVPLVAEIRKHTEYTEAVDIITEALQPLGGEYVNTIRSGLLGGWVDRYENQGKRSGAFSSGGFESEPYILMNYKPDVIRDVFTLAHEGGHSMHSWYSVRNNPFLCHDYTIFEAEVASTFNEELLFRSMVKKASDPKERAYLLSIRASDILATLYRQTMFAEFEMITHQLVESGTPLTLDRLRAEYKKLLTAYFGPAMHFEEVSDLECLRIPHFYRAFYVYKYATGISASLALAERVLSGGETERNDYFNFLKSGGSRYPIEALKVAGVDMASPEPVRAACNHFGEIVTELEKALKTIL
ncbi:oligoendopeptidase F [Treponema phagedenis]|uniref:Oligopeptidase F n=1 Tax=Treponema phagedenis TaxID=162 RepID=A0A0B7GXV6_TREPH|nr:oligoendopeptidase F [Treponema phagedenis]NVP24106.1 oligoendopeptidase F [Treponema phagedenis]QEJ96246.1 oligoendopeptidase F [Treponema phagedenis]QEJ99330.1 oligoendopeptidase F [Treponema phagedenis]QEK00025.1 oligoendopeptidase F [Treponema phagedenis]QEK04901.1 oligoendopeptidase F [Treponema phagedenis]